MRFEVDGARVSQAAGAVQTSAEQIRAEVDGMMRHLVELQACWQGQAATQFQDVVARWRATQERVRTGLEEIRQAMTLAAQQYEEAEAAAARMFSG